MRRPHHFTRVRWQVLALKNSWSIRWWQRIILSETAGTYYLRLHLLGHDAHQGVQHGTGLEHDVEHHGFVDDQFRRTAIFFCSRRNSGGCIGLWSWPRRPVLRVVPITTLLHKCLRAPSLGRTTGGSPVTLAAVNSGRRRKSHLSCTTSR